jgi:hypothetical protein
VKSQFLTIQKLIKLLDEFHLKEFHEYLAEVKANIPLRLVESINDHLIDAQTPDDLCLAVYGKNDAQTRKSFNQLASHTIRLSAYLSKNYPNYLLHNVSRIEKLINSGRSDEANILADALLDISERIGDYQTQILTLKFLAQQSHLYKSQSEVVKHYSRIQELLQFETLINEMYIYSRKNFNISVKDDTILKGLDKRFKYFRNYHNHPEPSIRLLSRYFAFFLMYYYRPTEYLTEKVQKEIIEFDDEIQKNQVVVLQFMEDIYSKFMLFTLNLSTTDLSSKEGKAEYQKLLTHNRFLKFWQNYVNIPELYAIAIKATYFLTRYHSINHRSDFRQVLPSEDRLEIARLTKRCEELIKLDIWEPDHVTDLIHFRLTWSALLLLGERGDIKIGVDNLEKLMTSYQQITFSESMDSIFICLMLGYFAMDNYRMCVESFKRYVKLSKGRVVNSENDLEIHTYYYVAQWITSGRKQYLNKISENYQRASQHSSHKVIQQTILELISYFKIPVSV